MKKFLFLIMLIGVSCYSFAQDQMADEILGCGKKNGLCLLIEPNELKIATELAAKSDLFISILISDSALAEKWSFELSRLEVRNKISVIQQKFSANFYGSNLLNLIVLCQEDLTKSISANDLNRILCPNGFLISKSKLGNLPESVIDISKEYSSNKHFKYVFKKNDPQIPWAPADSLKWRADPRAHINIGFVGLSHGSGKFVYRELMESDEFPKVSSIIFMRDNFNGRTLWQIEEPLDTWGKYRVNAFTPINFSMAIDEENQFFYISHDGKLLCLDAETGKLKAEIVSEKAQPGTLTLVGQSCLIYNNTVFSTKNFKKIFNFSGNYLVVADKLYSLERTNLKCYSLADGKIVFEKNLDWLDAKIAPKMQMVNLCKTLVLYQSDRWVRPFSVFCLDITTGEKKWNLDLPGIYSLPVRPTVPKEKVFTGVPLFTELDNKIIVYTIELGYHEEHQEGFFTRINPATGEIEEKDFGYPGKLFGSNCNNVARRLGDYLFYWHNIWYNLKTKERKFPYLIHPGCFTPTTASHGYVYNVPSRKGGPIEGITALGAADIKFDQTLGGKELRVTNLKPTIQDDTTANDWPMFRNGVSRGSFSSSANISSEVQLAWSFEEFFSKRSFSIMHERRTGLTAASIAYGMAFSVDIDSQTVFALNVESGKLVWSRTLPSRIDFAPSLAKGLCILSGKDGWVYSLDAKTGKLIYQLLTAPMERYIGGQEKIESLWPSQGDIFVKDNIGYVSNGFATNVHGGSRYCAFELTTGKNIWSQCIFTEETVAGYPGASNITGFFTSRPNTDFLFLNEFQIDLKTGTLNKGQVNVAKIGPTLFGKIDELLSFGNSLGRINEDRAHFLFSNGLNKGRVICFDDQFTATFTFKPKGETFINQGECRINGINGNTIKWSTEPIELMVDDLALTSKYVIAVGHYLRTKEAPQVWLLNREDGVIVKKIELTDLPAFGGLSVANERIFIACRQGKLICLEAKK